jgi:hypothetical protein
MVNREQDARLPGSEIRASLVLGSQISLVGSFKVLAPFGRGCSLVGKLFQGEG